MLLVEIWNRVFLLNRKFAYLVEYIRPLVDTIGLMSRIRY
jgi:hypothetical protein